MHDSKEMGLYPLGSDKRENWFSELGQWWPFAMLGGMMPWSRMVLNNLKIRSLAICGAILNNG